MKSTASAHFRRWRGSKSFGLIEFLSEAQLVEMSFEMSRKPLGCPWYQDAGVMTTRAGEAQPVFCGCARSRLPFAIAQRCLHDLTRFARHDVFRRVCKMSELAWPTTSSGP